MATDEKDETSKDATDEAASASERTADEAEAKDAVASDEAAAEKVAVKDAEPPAKADTHAHDAEAEHLISEPDRVNVGMIGAITFAIIVATVAVVVGVQQFFTQTISGEVNKKVYEPEDPAKKELAAVETAKLSKYQWASQKDGIVRIPVVRARELVLAEYGKMAAYQPGVMPAPAPSEAPAPATSSSVEPATSASVAPSASVSGAPAASGSAPPATSTSAAPSASGPSH